MTIERFKVGDRVRIRDTEHRTTISRVIRDRGREWYTVRYSDGLEGSHAWEAGDLERDSA